ncbi:MAG: hypothetical protein Q9191_002594, partial [Dirinaria sp. TL-2023a]
AHNASQKHVSYYHQYEYGHWTTWYYAIIIFVFTILNVYRFITAKVPESSTRPTFSTRLQTKSVAAVRFLSYRRLRGSFFDRLGLPSLGLLTILLLSVLFLCILTFSVRPYYRQHRGYGSPPLAVRTGLMAAACTPLIVVLSGKANLVTLLTGISHERLNIVHRWVGYMCLGLSVVHTVPFLVAPYRDGGYAALHKQFYKPGAFEYTGVPPLAMLAGITVFSIPFIRNRFYESFYFLHILLYITYIGLCFWHFGREGDSWNYLWATLAIWLATLLARVFWFNRAVNIRESWINGSPMQKRDLVGGMTRLDILAPKTLNWSPGQHFFVRVPGLDLFGNHPFTSASAFKSADDIREKSGGSYPQKVTFYIRTHAGFTKALAAHAQSQSRTPSTAVLEGPFGGIPYKIENTFDRIVLVAGGGGVTACLPWMEHLAMKRSAGTGMRVTSVKLVWAVRRAEHLKWIEESIDEVHKVLGEDFDFVENFFHVTREATSFSKPSQNDLEKGNHNAVSQPAPSGLRNLEHDNGHLMVDRGSGYKTGRPCLKEVIANLLVEAGRTMVIGQSTYLHEILEKCKQTDLTNRLWTRESQDRRIQRLR